MAFLRTFSAYNIARMTTGAPASPDTPLRFSRRSRFFKLDPACNASLFTTLKKDVESGEVFPAIRNNELHFYYKGGCLFKFTDGTFIRDRNFELYADGDEGLPPYERAKRENERKNTNAAGGITERQLLDRLYRYTFHPALRSTVVVLDVEVNLGGRSVRKCDLVLLNTETDEIMFVEGKVFSDDRVRRAIGYLPEVIEQVDAYTSALAEHRRSILMQYGEYVRLINTLFGTSYNPPKKLIEPAKLLVYKTGGGKAENVRYTIDIINEKLGEGNVMWVKDDEPTLLEIWNALSGKNV